MSIGTNEEREMLRDSARRFFEAECGEDYVRAMEGHETGWDPDHWKKMADLGWHALLIPERAGGAGLQLADLAVVVEEAGRALLPGPLLSSQIVVGMLSACGSEEQQAAHFPGIADGSAVHVIAVTEKQGRWGAQNIALKARTDGVDVVLSGTKRFVPYVQGADVIWVLARGDKSLLAVPVPRNAGGLTVNPLQTFSADHQAELVLDDIRVSKSDVVKIGSYDQVSVPALVMECAWLSGLAEMDFEITLDYAKQRHQFGKPIGSFQAIQHRCADMASDVETMRGITEQAALAASEGADGAPLLASIAKAWCSEASRRIVAGGQQIHGGIGFTMEYRIQLYFRRQKRGELFWGDADFHRDIVKESLAI